MRNAGVDLEEIPAVAELMRLVLIADWLHKRTYLVAVRVGTPSTLPGLTLDI